MDTRLDELFRNYLLEEAEETTRQDRGRKMFAGAYIYQYLYIARYPGDEEAARTAARIAGDYLGNRRRPAPDCRQRGNILPSVPSRGLYRFYERHGSLLPNCFHRGGVEG